VAQALGFSQVDPESGRIFVTNPVHDVVGYRVVQRLLRAGYPLVRIGTTGTELSVHDSPETDRILSEWNAHEHAELAVFDWDQEDTWDKALTDVKSVLVCLPYREPLWYHQRFPLFLQACEKAGVRHFVKLSFYHARECHNASDPHRPCDGTKTPYVTIQPDHAKPCVYQDVMYVHAQGKCDQLVVDTLHPDHTAQHLVMNPLSMMEGPKMAYTLLSAGRFMSDPLITQHHELVRDQKPAPLHGASQNEKVSYVSPNDVAEVAVRVLLEPRAHVNHEYTLTNRHTHILTDQEVAGLLGKYLNKPVMYVNQSLDAFADGLRKGGVPDYHVRDYTAWERIKAAGVESHLAYATHDVGQICGRAPESFADYLTNTADMTPGEKP